jgi:hypothetical protein
LALSASPAGSARRPSRPSPAPARPNRLPHPRLGAVPGRTQGVHPPAGKVCAVGSDLQDEVDVAVPQAAAHEPALVQDPDRSRIVPGQRGVERSRRLDTDVPGPLPVRRRRGHRTCYVGGSRTQVVHLRGSLGQDNDQQWAETVTTGCDDRDWTRARTDKSTDGRCAPMASDSVTLALDGNPTLDDLAAALAGLRNLLNELSGPFAQGAKVIWVVDNLDTGSAVTTFRGSARNAAAVRDITRAYLAVGVALGQGQVPFPDFPAVDRAASELANVISENVPSLRFETADDDVIVSALPASASAAPTGRDLPGSYGAVLGRVQTLSNRGSLRFTLYDLLHDRAVSCYLQEGQQELMRGAWDRVALVRGWVKRDPATRRPVAVRRVRAIEIQEEGEASDWRSASGALREDHDGERAESVIRRLRDAR